MAYAGLQYRARGIIPCKNKPMLGEIKLDHMLNSIMVNNLNTCRFTYLIPDKVKGSPCDDKCDQGVVRILLEGL
ncbi:hypothetical protein OUZ56_031908 [Daphnia magna]|uniref:Uncharacterized protein n=1 Tax=Daphnia magna TaxID=35525 RepID=A0ABQ9ZVL2_9CRUS|nr:hypothetical protein OUZ56_031908 [Daphnia magna]